MVHYDPLVLPTGAAPRRIAELVQGLQTTRQAGRRWRLPACYDGVAPDLDDVAARTGLTPDAGGRASQLDDLSRLYARLPAGAGLPGRRAGSSALAAALDAAAEGTGGLVRDRHADDLRLPDGNACGWHLIGRSPVPFLQRHPRPAALLAPGDTVSFTPVSLREYEDLLGEVGRRRAHHQAHQREAGSRRMKPDCASLAPGLLTTVQDLGRPGHQHLGDSGRRRARPGEPARRQRAGRQCARSRRARSGLCRPDASGGRRRACGSQLSERRRRSRFCPSSARERAGACEHMRSIRVRRGEVVRIGSLTGGAVLYVAVEGGFDIDAGARQRLDLYPRRLRRLAGPRADRRRPAAALPAERKRPRRMRASEVSILAPPPRFRAILGPQDDHFAGRRDRGLLRQRIHSYRPGADRMGMRLDRLLPRSCRGFDIRLRRHRARLDPGAGQRAADRAARRPPDHRRLSEDRDRHFGRHAGARPACRSERRSRSSRSRWKPRRTASPVHRRRRQHRRAGRSDPAQRRASRSACCSTAT